MVLGDEDLVATLSWRIVVQKPSCYHEKGGKEAGWVTPGLLTIKSREGNQIWSCLKSCFGRWCLHYTLPIDGQGLLSIGHLVGIGFGTGSE
ncbi:unnamed protein product [Calypogeia fissa]